MALFLRKKPVEERAPQILPNEASSKKRIKRAALAVLAKIRLAEKPIPYPEEVFMIARAILDRLIAEDGQLKA